MLLYTGAQSHGRGRQTAEDIVEIHPCTEDGFVTLEARFDLSKISGCTFGEYIDPQQMCHLLRTVEFFDRFRCSDQMGYAYGESGGRRIHAFQGGKIIVRRAEDETDARRILRALARVMWGSVRCDCDSAMVHCLSGACDRCLSGVCGCQLEPPMESTKAQGELLGSEVIATASSLQYGGVFMASAETLRRASEVLVQLTERLVSQTDGLAKLENEVRGLCTESERLATSFLISTDNGFHAGFAFLLHGVALNILNALEALIALSGKENLEDLSGVPSFVSKCFGTFFDSLTGNLDEIEQLRGKILERTDDEHITALVDASFHSAKALGKVFPK